MIGWNFPPNNYGQKDGLNDSGIETFKGVPYDSLAREVIQNSLDASHSENGAPVHVHFTLNHVPKNIFPGVAQFIDILKACKKEKPKNEAIQKFFSSALSIMDADMLPVLKISDYNTTGLLGSGGDGEFHDWENLIKSSGSSDKEAGKGGSFGIGKNAPFACSRIRAVCYSTKDFMGNTAFQGVSKLMTHKNTKGEDTRGAGFYGMSIKNEPITDFTELDTFFRRDDIGTDVFIFGFNEAKDWESEIIKSVIENYFIAIQHNMLVVKVGDTLINASRLPELLDHVLSEDKECLAPKYYKAMVSPDKHPFIEEDLYGMGRVELYVLPERNYPKRVAIVRGTGMKIFNKDRFQTPMQFVGVFIARGEGINNFMRSLEPPSHNAWEPHRHDDPDEAKAMVKKIYSWINDNVRSLALIDESEELDVEGIAEFLPDDADDFEPDVPDNEEGIADGAPKEVEIKIVNPPPSSQASVSGDLSGEEDGQEGGELIDGDNLNEGSGGNHPTIPTDIVGSDGESGVEPNTGGGNMSTNLKKPINLNKSRVFCIDPDKGIYKVVYIPDWNGQGYIKLKTVGDDGVSELAPILSASESNSENTYSIDHSGHIGPIQFDKGLQGEIEVQVKDSLHCAMEVSAHAN